MSLYLGIAILLFILLFFTTKEGFYSDSNITGAADELKTVNKKIETLKKTVDGFLTSDLSAMEAVSSLNKLLQTKDATLYSSGVVKNVQNIKDELDLYQANVMLLNETIISLPKTAIVYQYNESDKNTKISGSLTDVLTNLTQQANKLTSKLNKIPDS